jgi:hypothetical protein
VLDEELHAKLIVPDTGPLITLAAADSLDYRAAWIGRPLMGFAFAFNPFYARYPSNIA